MRRLQGWPRGSARLALQDCATLIDHLKVVAWGFSVSLRENSELISIAISFQLSKMSGIEIAGLVFGISPLLIETIKSYRTLSDRFHTFRHYSREVKKINLQLRVCQRIFLNECSLLLQGVVDEEKAQAMLEDSGHSLWTSGIFNDQFQNLLSESYVTCKDVIKGIREILKEIGENMESFDAFESQREKVGPPTPLIPLYDIL
jgi:hypothetical protein